MSEPVVYVVSAFRSNGEPADATGPRPSVTTQAADRIGGRVLQAYTAWHRSLIPEWLQKICEEELDLARGHTGGEP